MSGGFVARWAVTRLYDVTPADCDSSGEVREAAVRRWAGAVCDDYLGRCAALQAWRAMAGLEVTRRLTEVATGLRLGTPKTVAVSASATEMLPQEFTLAVRIRALGGDGATIDTRCVVAARDPASGEPQSLPEPVRQELIAIERDAVDVN